MASMSVDLVTDCLARLDEAHQNGVITDHSLATMQTWLKEPRYAEFAEQLGAAGLNLVLVDIDDGRLRACCGALRDRYPVEVRPVVLDLRREDLLDIRIENPDLTIYKETS